MEDKLMIALLLVFVGLLLLTWSVARLIAAIHDVHDDLFDHVAWDDLGRPVIAITKAQWNDEDEDG